MAKQMTSDEQAFWDAVVVATVGGLMASPNTAATKEQFAIYASGIASALLDERRKLNTVPDQDVSDDRAV